MCVNETYFLLKAFAFFSKMKAQTSLRTPKPRCARRKTRLSGDVSGGHRWFWRHWEQAFYYHIDQN